MLLYGLGLLGSRMFKAEHDHNHIFQPFWLGLVLLFYILQIVHLFARINNWVLLCIVLFALIGYWLNMPTWNLQIPRLTISRLLNGPIIILIALWTANRTIGPVANSDTALYHLASTAWNAAYPIVKGLGNLHERFAFNSSYFLYSALTDVGPWPGHSQHILNGFLLTILLIQLVSYSRNLFSFQHKVALEPAFALIFVGPIITEALKGNIPSLSPDFPIFIMGIVLSCRLLGYLTDSQLSSRAEQFNLFSIVALSCLGITMKLSFLPLGFVASAIAIIACYNRLRPVRLKAFFRLLWPTGWFCTSFLGVWMLRNVLLSGYPVFPMTIGALPVPWRIPRSLAISADLWIRSWARQPWQPWPDVLQNWQWIYPWMHTMPADIAKVLFVSTGAILLFAASVLWRRRWRFWQILTPPLAGILFWFLSAPSFRFAGASFWILAIGLLALGLYNFFENSAGWLRLSTVTTAAIVCIYVVPWRQPLLLHPSSTQILPTIPTPETTTVQTSSGLSLQTPLVGSYSCWRIILCTPYFRPTLHAFDPQNIAKGFYIDRTFTYADINQSALPNGIVAPADVGVALIDQLLPIPPAPRSQSQLRLLIYSETPATIHALLHTAANQNQANLLAENRQIVLKVDQNTYEYPLSANPTTKLDIPLHKDFNVVTIELRNGAIILDAQHSADENAEPSDGHPVQLHIHQIEFIW